MFHVSSKSTRLLKAITSLNSFHVEHRWSPIAGNAIKNRKRSGVENTAGKLYYLHKPQLCKRTSQHSRRRRNLFVPYRLSVVRLLLLTRVVRCPRGPFHHICVMQADAGNIWSIRCRWLWDVFANELQSRAANAPRSVRSGRSSVCGD